MLVRAVGAARGGAWATAVRKRSARPGCYDTCEQRCLSVLGFRRRAVRGCPPARVLRSSQARRSVRLAGARASRVASRPPPSSAGDVHAGVGCMGGRPGRRASRRFSRSLAPVGAAQRGTVRCRTGVDGASRRRPWARPAGQIRGAAPVPPVREAAPDIGSVRPTVGPPGPACRVRGCPPGSCGAAWGGSPGGTAWSPGGLRSRAVAPRAWRRSGR